MFKTAVKKIIPNRIKECVKKKSGVSSTIVETKYIVSINDLKKHQNKRVMVTGATGAIGSAICHKLFLEGAIVGVCARNMTKAEELIKKIEAEYIDAGKLYPLYLDVNKENSIDQAIDDFVKLTGGLDAFVNNAGGGAREKSKLIHQQSIEIIDNILNTNLRGTILCDRKAAQIMVEQNAGIILNMSSVVGMCGKSRMSDYAAAKAGIIGFTKSLAIELGSHNIRVNCISPGMVNQVLFDAGLPEKSTTANCFGRFGYTDEVASVVSFLLSNDAKYITGQNLVVDGGRSLGLMGD